ncbi:nuclear transport factor 2 family protein [Streptomyces sp. NPDC003077]|uniref:nuclear transport factor 2 family protein n=1 Tax=Streptomyces sp. NPDC003077 TaxID=3154443 RepID=UPI0033B94CB9
MSTTAPTPTPTSTRAAVDELLRRIGEGDPERIAELYADPCDWKLNWEEDAYDSPAVPWIRPRSTRADAADHYRQLAAHHVPEKVGTEIERVLVDGPHAVILGEIRQTARPTGHSYRARFALHLTFENGLITRHHVYEDSLAVIRAFTTE